MPFVVSVAIYLVVCISFAAYLSLFERKIIGRLQLRLGPSYTGFAGCLQPVADALKLFFKAGALKSASVKAVFAITLLLATSLLSMTLIPFSENLYLFNPKYGLLYILLLHAMTAFSEILLGIESGSKYGKIGGIRAFFQIVSGNFAYMLLILLIGTLAGSFNLIEIVKAQSSLPFIFVSFPMFVIYFIVTLLNLNKIPFDFTEAESEIIAGNYVEYGGMLFGMIYLSEYLNLIFQSCLIIVLFGGGWNSYFGSSVLYSETVFFLKISVVLFLIITIRAILPRYTQHYMLHLSWVVFCPAIIIYFMLIR